MGTIEAKLLHLQGTKAAIKTAIEAKGVTVPTGTDFRDYGDKILAISGGSEEPSEVIPWVRDSNWLTVPNNEAGVQRVSILTAVFNTDSEYVAFKCSGNYTVNWGDGTTENFNSGVRAEHKYTYSNIQLDSSKLEYKQAIITITPQAGYNLTSVLLGEFHSVLGGPVTYRSVCNFLEVKVNSSAMTTFKLNYSTAGTAYYLMNLLESFYLGEHSLTSMDKLFRDCYVLANLVFSHTNGINNYTSAFMNCYSLQSIPPLALDVPCILNNAFNYCRSLVEIQDIRITPLTSSSLVSTFNTCTSLKTINLTVVSNIDLSLDGICNGCSRLIKFNFSIEGSGNILSLSNGFTGCYGLREAPELPTSGCTTFASMFNTCLNLIKLPEYDYSSATTLASMLSGCTSLVEVPNFNTSSSLTAINSMFAGCTNLIYGASFADLSGVTTIGLLYSNCSALISVPSYFFPAITGSANTVFGNTNSLIIVPSINLGNPTATSSIFSNVFALRRMLMPLKYSFNIANCKMSGSALDEMYGILPTVTGQTITITGTIGASGDTPSIATAKGWTVTG